MPATSRRTFDQQLDDLEAHVVRMATIVSEAVAAGREALLAGEKDAARAVLEGDAELDHAAWTCETRAYELLARQQPAARDLRRVLTAVRVAHELERCGNLVRHVAEAPLRHRVMTITPALRGLLGQMADEAQRLLRAATDAYVERDVAGAAALDVWDDRMDELHRRLLDELFAAQLGLESTIELVLVGRYLERIADHAVVIGERVHYLVTGVLPPVGASETHQL
jgi:phosphate transport system protein